LMCQEGKKPQSNSKSDIWVCPSCTFSNNDVAVFCKICQNPKPNSLPSSPRKNNNSSMSPKSNQIENGDNSFGSSKK